MTRVAARMRFALGWLGLAALVGCSSARIGASDSGRARTAESREPIFVAPSVTFPAHFAEGHNEPAPDGGAPLASASASAAEAHPPETVDPSLPDPDPPLKTPVQWDYALRYRQGTVTVTRVARVVLPNAVVTPRKMGRFAIELSTGRELVERVRFDFPLLAADQPETTKHPLRESPRFAPGADTSAVVRVPDSDRATAATLVDRLTGKRTPLEFPPTPTPAPEKPAEPPQATQR